MHLHQSCAGNVLLGIRILLFDAGDLGARAQCNKFLQADLLRRPTLFYAAACFFSSLYFIGGDPR
jgi:hypothetical protein